MKGGEKRKNKKRHHRSTHSRRPTVDAEVLTLKKALQSAQSDNQRLASINTNLSNQVKELKHKEINWVLEKGKLEHKSRTVQRLNMMKYCSFKKQLNKLGRTSRTAETDDAVGKKENKDAFENTLDESERRRVEEIATELKELQEKIQEQEVMLRKNEKLISRLEREIQALAREFLQEEYAPVCTEEEKEEKETGAEGGPEGGAEEEGTEMKTTTKKKKKRLSRLFSYIPFFKGAQ